MCFGISRRPKTTIREAGPSKKSDPQITHKLPMIFYGDFVDKMLITFLLQCCNDKVLVLLGLYVPGFLPTMKLQLSQLP
jgi:hypothetical protein